MTTKKQPDAWCAHHIDGNYMLCTIAYDEYHAMSILQDQLDDEERKDGWQIKPVCLVTPERLEELEGVGDKAYDWFCNNMAETLNSELWNDFKKEVLGDD